MSAILICLAIAIDGKVVSMACESMPADTAAAEIRSCQASPGVCSVEPLKSGRIALVWSYHTAPKI